MTRGKKINDIVFASFQGFSKSGSQIGMLKVIFPILERLMFEKTSKLTYYVSNANNYKGQLNIKTINWMYPKIRFLFSLLNKFIIHKPYYKIRFTNERIFDFFLKQRIRKPIILITTTHARKSLIKNKKLGGTNVIVTGNPDNVEIYRKITELGKKYNVTIDDIYSYRNWLAHGLKSFRLYDFIICRTESEYSTIKLRFPNKNITLIETLWAPQWNRHVLCENAKPERLTFCYIAHSAWLKGLTTLLEAWEKINTSNLELKIGGMIIPQLREFIYNRFGSIRNVTYLGRVGNLQEFYSSSHVCIVPSLLDAGPATISEAMDCGLPVIASDGCGFKVLVTPYKDGFIFKAGDAVDLKSKIEWFMNNQDQILTMGRSAKEKINEIRNSDPSVEISNHLNKLIHSIRNDAQVL
jgi:glycosyltransferase involved in cell wall biosynthesis